LILVGIKKLFRMIPADRNQQYEDLVAGRKIFRSKGTTLTNHFKRWYFHAKESQKILETTAWSRYLVSINNFVNHSAFGAKDGVVEAEF